MTLIRKALTLLLFLWASAATPSLWAAPSSALPTLGAGPANRAATAQEKLRKDAICTECHDETDSAPVLNLYQGKHGVRGDARTPTCQGCHGESLAHVRGNTGQAKGVGSDKRPPVDISFRKGGAYPVSNDRARGDTCVSCHEGGNRTHWDGGQHQLSGVTCSDCHSVHRPADKAMAKATQGEVCYACHKKQRAETHRISTHPMDSGKVSCSDCHNPHGSTGPKLVRKNTVNETCYSCHAEKRGPFLWQHASATDDCTNCHTPHGSTVAPLLKARGPWLCQSCHGNFVPHVGNVYSGAGLPGRPVAGANQSTAATNPVNPLTGQRIAATNPPVQLAFQGCTNCHQAIHGSNHPAGNFFLR